MARSSNMTPATTPIIVPAKAPGLMPLCVLDAAEASLPCGAAVGEGTIDIGDVEIGFSVHPVFPATTKNGVERTLIIGAVEVSVLNATTWYRPGGTSTMCQVASSASAEMSLPMARDTSETGPTVISLAAPGELVIVRVMGTSTVPS